MIRPFSAFMVCFFLLTCVSSAAAQPIHIFRGPGSTFLGIQMRDVTQNDVEELRLPDRVGVIVEKVAEGSPAEAAGLNPSDLITAYAGIPVLGSRHLQRLVSETAPGRPVELEIYRDGTRLSLEARIESQDKFKERAESGHFHFYIDPDDFDMPGFDLQERHPFPIWRGHQRLGIKGVSLSEQMADFLGIPGRQGILVTEVLEETPASRTGLQAGDVITAVEGESVSDTDELRRYLDRGSVELQLLRRGSEISLSVTLSGSRSSDQPSHNL